MSMLNPLRTRFAPSPTGYLHIGGARTALYSWLFARKMGGDFILRIEDTDEARSTDDSVNAIIDSMKWLGLDWDEGPGKENPKYAPYFQMAARDKGIYKACVDRLVNEGKAYSCYCTAEEIDEMRKAAQEKKQMPKYDGRCSKLTPVQRKEKESKGLQAVIRFKTPQTGKVIVKDIIRGDVEFDNSMLDDLVIMKANGTPTYNFACVIDDYRMNITHVIRGDDHLSNTPKQIHIYEALGFGLPEFAHLSMILGTDGSRLSKRHGHTSVLEYKNEGYLPEAMLNYLALLGWSTQESQQLFEKKELIEKFSLERCSKSPAVFDTAKLVWMNGEYVRKAGGEKLFEMFESWASETKNTKVPGWDKALLKRLIISEFEKVKLLKDIPDLFDFFFNDNIEYNPEAVSKVLKAGTAKMVLEESSKRLVSFKDFTAPALEHYAREFAAEKAIKAGQVFHPIRVAVSGRTTGPSLFYMMEFMGREKVVERIKNTLAKFF